MACALMMSAVVLAQAPAAKDQADVEAALARYSKLVLAMDADGIAALYTADGEVRNGDQPPVVGREAIGKFLHEFSGYKVLTNELVVTETRVSGSTAIQRGTFRQSVRVPAGDVVDAHGHFEAEWRRSPNGTWQLAKMTTTA